MSEGVPPCPMPGSDLRLEWVKSYARKGGMAGGETCQAKDKGWWAGLGGQGQPQRLENKGV